MEGIKGERSEQQSDRVENHHQHGLDLGGLAVQNVRFFREGVFRNVQAEGPKHSYDPVP